MAAVASPVRRAQLIPQRRHRRLDLHKLQERTGGAAETGAGGRTTESRPTVKSMKKKRMAQSWENGSFVTTSGYMMNANRTLEAGRQDHC